MMLKYVSNFYILLSILLSVVGIVPSLRGGDFIFFFVVVGVALLLFSVGLIVLEFAKMQTQIELQTKFMRHMSKKPKSRK